MFWHPLLIFFVAGSAAAEEVSYRNLPSNMAVLGDSITEGFFAGSNLDSGLSWTDYLDILGVVTNTPDMDERYGKFRERFGAPGHNWATSSNESDFVFSHYERLKKLNPNIQTFNFAIAGTQASQLSTQVDNLLHLEDERGIVMDYVPIFIGHNDLTSSALEDVPTAESLIENLEFEIRRLLGADGKRSILLMGLMSVN